MNKSADIPVIESVNDINSDTLDRAMQYGIAYIKIPDDINSDLSAVADTGKLFFRQAEAIKKQDPFIDGNGYMNHADNSLEDITVQRYIFRGRKPAKPYDAIQAKMLRSREYLGSKIILPLLTAFFKRLELEKYLPELLAKPDYTLSSIYYPADNDNTRRLKAHKDTAVISVVWADQAGFEAELGGEWLPLAPRPGYITMQLGRALESMTNGLCHAVEHRVTVESHIERLSIASFFVPHPDTPFVNYKTGDVINPRYGDYVQEDIAKFYPQKAGASPLFKYENKH